MKSGRLRPRLVDWLAGTAPIRFMDFMEEIGTVPIDAVPTTASRPSDAGDFRWACEAEPVQNAASVKLLREGRVAVMEDAQC